MKKGYSKMFMWLFIGLFISFGVGYITSLNIDLIITLFSGSKFLILLLFEIGLVIFFSARIRKMSKPTAIVCYSLYSLLTGLTFGSIFLVYELSSLITIFLITSLIFLVFSFIGYNTKRDLSKFSMWLFMSLIGILLVGIINIFIKSSVLEMILSIIGILIFCGYIVYDLNKADALIAEIGEDKGAIFAAFQLYLDFINIFLDLLRLFGKAKDN